MPCSIQIYTKSLMYIVISVVSANFVADWLETGQGTVNLHLWRKKETETHPYIVILIVNTELNCVYHHHLSI